MSKQKNQGLIPKLRFPEFSNGAEWESIQFIDTVDNRIKWSFIGGPFGSNLKSSDYTETGIRIIQLQNIGDGEFLNDYKIFTSIAKADDLLANNIYAGEILLSKMGDPVGRACLVPFFHERYVMCSDGIRLVVDQKKFDQYFIYQLINSYSFRSLIEKTATGSTRKRIGLDALKTLPMIVPKNKFEQQKIADCLSSLDELLTANTQKLELLKSHKKGLMQKLFPAEGKSVPELRFPEFSNDAEWESIQFIDTADKKIKWSFIGGPFGSNLKSSDYTETGIRIIQLQNIGDGKFLNDYKIFTSIAKADELLANNIYAGDILLSKMGDPVGRACLVPFFHERYVMCSDGIRLVVDQKKFDQYFIYQLINSYSFRSLIEKTATGSTRKRIGLDALKKLPMMVPKNKFEQQKISNCFSSIDELISAQSSKIETLENHKIGLMQKLFPSVDGGIA